MMLQDHQISSKDPLLSKLKRKIARFKCDLSIAASYRLKAYNFCIKEVFTFLALSSLYNHVTVLISCKEGSVKCRVYLVVSLH